MSPLNVALASKSIGPIGLGLMGMTWRPEPQSTEDSYLAMFTALREGANFWNAGEFYGPPENNSCHLLNGYFTRNPQDTDKVVLSMKGGMLPGSLQPDCSEQNVRQSVEECLRLLDGKKSIDIFECARVDPAASIEETISVLVQLVKEGKIGDIGLSEVKAITIEKVHAIHPVTAVEAELSLWATEILHNGVAATCGKLGIPIVAYGPAYDFRKTLPKFQDDVLEQNNQLFDEIEKLADRKGVTKAQIAVGWVRACGNRTITLPGGEKVKTGMIIPIPGATKPERVIENSKLVELTDEEMHQIEEILRRHPVKGDRYTTASSAIWGD